MLIPTQHALQTTIPILLIATLISANDVKPVRAQGWPDPNAHDVVPYLTSGLTHGPSLGAPTDSSVRVWIRTAKPTEFQVLFGTQLPLNDRSKRVTGRSDAARDNIGVIQLEGLKPNTRYYYGVLLDNQQADLRVDFHDPWPSFRTLPNSSTSEDAQHNPHGRFNFAFSIGCCASQDPMRSGGQYTSPPAFDTLLNQYGDEVAFHIMNGDTTYEELRDGTLEGIRANYKLYWRRGRSWARMTRNIPTVFTYDDHEIGWDIHGCGEVGLGPGKWLIRDFGTSVWQEYCGWSSFPAAHHGRVRFGDAAFEAGKATLHDDNANFAKLDLNTVSTLHVDPYTPRLEDGRLRHRSTRQSHPNAGVYRIHRIVDAHTLELDRPVPADGNAPYSIGTRHWFDWQVGNCHFFALDTRGERTRPNFDDYRDPSRFVLGQPQKDWLLNGVRNSTADFVFIVSPDPFVLFHTAYHVDATRGGVPKGDGFSSFVSEREELIAELDKLDKPVLIFTGDVHASASVQVTDNVWEMMCGPMGSTNHPLGTCGGGTMPVGGDWESHGRSVRIKWIGTFPDNVHFARLRQPYFAVVQLNNVTPSPRTSGTGYQWLAFDAPQVVVRWHDGYTGRLVYAEGISSDVHAHAPGNTNTKHK